MNETKNGLRLRQGDPREVVVYGIVIAAIVAVAVVAYFLFR